MAKLGQGSVTITDLTDTLPVSLYLDTNYSERVQRKTGNLYTPNYTEENKELIITPSLFLGSKEIILPVLKNEETKGNLYYQVTDIKDENGSEKNISYNSSNPDGNGLDYWVDNQGRLHYKKNLTKNLTIEVFISDLQIKGHHYSIPLVTEVSPITILLLEENNSNYNFLIEASRDFFDETNSDNITLTAVLYRGLNKVENNISYIWDIGSDEDSNKTTDDADNLDNISPTKKDFLSKSQSITVKRAHVHTSEIFICTATLTDGSELTFSASQVIRDFVDVYSAILIPDSSKVLTPDHTSIKIEDQVWYKTTLVDTNRLTYEWALLTKDGKTLYFAKSKSLSKIEVKIGGNVYSNLNEDDSGNGKAISIPKEDFTICCKTTVDGDKAQIFSTLALEYSPISYSIKVEPKNQMIPVLSNGNYKGSGNFTYNLKFELLGENKKPLLWEDTGSNIPTLSKDYTEINNFKCTQAVNEDNKKIWSFDIAIEVDTSATPLFESSDFKIYEFTYEYLGGNYTEEFYITKNYQGEVGEPGYVIDLTNNFHSFPGEQGHAVANSSVETYINAFFGDQTLKITQIEVGDNTNRKIIYGNNPDNHPYIIEDKIKIEHITKDSPKPDNSGDYMQHGVKFTTGDGISNLENSSGIFKFLDKISNIFIYITVKKHDSGNTITFYKDFSYIINYNGKEYFLQSDHSSIIRNQNGELNPNQLTISSRAREKTGNLSNYKEGIFIYSFNGTVWNSGDISSSGSYILKLQGSGAPEYFEKVYLRLYSAQAKGLLAELSQYDNEKYTKYLLDMEDIPVSVSLEGAEIGGENLLRWTKELPIERKKWETKSTKIQSIKEGDFNFFDFDIPEKLTDPSDQNSAQEQWTFIESSKIPFDKSYLGKTFSISFEIKVDQLASEGSNFEDPFKGTFGPYLIFNANYDDTGRGRYGGIFTLRPDGSSNYVVSFSETFKSKTWIRVSYSFILAENKFGAYDTTEEGPITWDECKYMSIRFYLSYHGKIQIRKPKLEIGNLPTLWSPSPYDINYEDISGMNLIGDSVKLQIEQQALQNNNKSFESILYPDTFYTFSFYESSWEQKGTTAKTERKFRIEIFNEEDLSSKLTFSFPDSYNASRTIQTFKTPSAPSSSKFSFCIYPIVAGDEQTNGILTLTKIKLEKGETATSYTITDEFLNSAIENLSASSVSTVYFDTVNGPMQTTLDNLQTAINNLSETYVTIEDAKGRIEAASSEVIAEINDPTDPDNIYFAQLKGSVIIDASNPSDPYIELTASKGQNNISSLRLTDDRIEFLDHGDPVAEIHGSYLRIKKGIFEEDLRIGKLQVSITDSGVGFLWGE